MPKLYIDTETVGLNGPCKLIQYSIDRGPIQFVRLYRDGTVGDLKPVWERLYDPHTIIVGYNLSFDLYHLYRVAHTETGTPLDGSSRPALPFTARTLDLYNHAVQTGPFAPWAFSKKTGKRVATIRRVPTVAADIVGTWVTDTLRERLPAGVSVSMSRHKVSGTKDLVTLSWVTAASMSLKAHAKHYGAKDVVTIENVWPLPRKEDERPWLPYPADYNRAYRHIEDQCEEIMRGTGPASQAFYEYAKRDIEYLWLVEDGLKNPAPDHHDAAVEIVAYTRYFGFPLDIDTLARTRDAYKAEVRTAEQLLTGINLRSSVQKLVALRRYEPWLSACNKTVLAQLVRDGDGPVVDLARAMLSHGKAKQRLDQVNKLLESATGRAHPSLRVMGTATGRMAGTDGLNFQGIAQASKTPDGKRIGIRAAMGAALGGDFAAFEVAIAASAWNDVQLIADLDAGLDIHLVTAVTVHPDLVGVTDYAGAVAARKDKQHPLHAKVERARSESKRVVFGLLYGAGPEKVEEVLALKPGEGRKILDRFFTRYAGLGAFRKAQEARFQTADVERWSAGSVATMADSAVDLVGFKRSFKFEADLADLFWRLGHDGLRTGIQGHVTRNKDKGPQTVDGAVRSALLGAALAIQQAVCRAAINMPVQATGANLNKLLAARIWREFHTPMLNVHDEQVFAPHPNLDVDQVVRLVRAFEDEHRRHVKHIAFDCKPVRCWADKG